MEESWEEKFRRDCKDLHAKIENGRDPDIDRILKDFPRENRFYNDKMESAAAVALKHKQIRIYNLLVSKRVCLGMHEDANEITSKFDNQMKQKIRKINMKNSIDVADHISILISKSKISPNACVSKISEMEDCIRKAFNDLNQIPRIQPILKVVAYAEKLSLTFDFCDDKVSNMDPTQDKDTEGCSYPTGDSFIGAKGLMRAGVEKYLYALGTLAHELTHCAMQLVYQNDRKPYKCSQDNEKSIGDPAEKLKKTDESGRDEVVILRSGKNEKISDKDRFSDICKKCEQNCKAKDPEPCINIVFQDSEYDEDKQHAELIVRVPHLLVLHKNDKKKLKQIESTYSELFNYFEEKVLSNIEAVIQRMKNIYKLNESYQSNLQNIEHYVERKFICLDANFKEVSENPLTEDQLIDHTKNVKIVLLSDEPGAGKTTNLIAITKKLKKRYPDHWIVVIDLKEFADFYKRDEDEPTNFRSINEIENYYCEKIFKFKNLEAKNFAELFEDNRVIFLMDGFDEISPSYKEFNLKLITAIIRKSDNRIWISTRPHLEKELQEKLNCSVFRLKPFTIKDRENFLKLKWKSEEIDEKIFNEKMQKVETILDEIIEKSDGIDPTSNPLIFTMISEIVDELSNQTNQQMNLYSIYEVFVRKKKEIFLKKGREAEKEIIEPHRWLNINAFHQEVAVKTIFEFQRHDCYCPSLCDRTTLPSPEEIARLGLMVYVENSNETYKNFRFIHRTFAEYFVADFIIESFSKFNIRVIYGAKEESLWKSNLDEKMFKIMRYNSKEVDTKTWINFILESYLLYSRSDRSSYYFSTFGNFKMVRYFIDSFWKTRLFVGSSGNKKLQNFEKALNSSERFFKHLFHVALEVGSDCWFKDVPKALEVKLRSVEFWKPWEAEKYSAMMISAKHSASFFLEFLEFIKKILDPEILRKMFFDVDLDKRNFLWHCSLETFKLILSDSPRIPLTRHEKEKLLQAPGICGFNMILYYVTEKSKEEFMEYYAIVNNFDKGMPEILFQGFSSNQYKSILHYCRVNYCCDKYEIYDDRFPEILEIIREFFELETIKDMFKIKDGFLPLFDASSQTNSSVSKLSFVDRIRYVDYLKIFWNFFEKIFEDEAERTSIMLQEDDHGFSAFDFAFFQCAGPDRVGLLIYIKKKYEIVYSEEDMRQRVIRDISSFSEADKASNMRIRGWTPGILMINVMLSFSKDFVRSLFLSYDGKPTFLKDKRTMSVLKPLLIKIVIFSEEEMNSLFQETFINKED